MSIDVYHCMNCGDRWTHGGMRDSFVRAAQHTEEMKHLVLVGDMDILQAQYERIQAGEALPSPNDANDPRPQPVDEVSPQQTQAVSKKLGISTEEAERLLIRLRELFGETLPQPEGRVEAW